MPRFPVAVLTALTFLGAAPAIAQSATPGGEICVLLSGPQHPSFAAFTSDKPACVPHARARIVYPLQSSALQNDDPFTADILDDIPAEASGINPLRPVRQEPADNQ